MQNITLIGMSGAGKSTIGRVLAMGTRQFYDTDTMLASRLGYHHVGEALEVHGAEAFLELESRLVCCHGWPEHRRFIVATGGSVVYRPEAMESLKQVSTIVYLQIPQTALERRVSFISRGIVNKNNLSYKDLHAERHNLYLQWADYIVNADDSPIGVSLKIMSKLGKEF